MTGKTDIRSQETGRTGSIAISKQRTANSGQVTADAPALQNWGARTELYVPMSGPSMIPTLRPLDLLEVLPYDERAVRVGDVVAFLPARKKTHVVHRVVRAGPQGIRTLGDNNLYEDVVDLGPEDLAGRVIAAWRGQKRRIVSGGSVGRLVARTIRIIRQFDRFISRVLRPIYYALARRGVLRAFLPQSLRPRVVRFGNPRQVTMMLLFFGWVIGRYDADLRRWVIRRPFKLFVDEAMLSELSVDPSE